MTVPNDINVVTTLEDVLSEVIDIQKCYVAQVCPECLAPCCKKVSYLFCEKDVLFFKLSGRKSIWKRETSQKRGCRFLGPAGCVLDLKSRPFICHRYICDDLERVMNKRGPELLITLKERLRIIDGMRSQMWSEYLEMNIGSP